MATTGIYKTLIYKRKKKQKTKPAKFRTSLCISYFFIYNLTLYHLTAAIYQLFFKKKNQDLYIMMTFPTVGFRFLIFTVAVVTGGGSGADKEWTIRGTGISNSIL